MQDAVHPERIIRFGTFELDLETEELRRNGLKLKLAGQPVQVLAILLEKPGRIVTREELQKRLWSDTFVDFDHNLNTAINKIREVLGDSAENPRFVETLPRRGYRFIGPVIGPESNETAAADAPIEVPVDRASDAEVDKSSTTATRTRSSHPLFWVSVGSGACALVVLLAVAAWYLRRPLPPPHITEYVRLTLDGRHKWPVGADASRLYLNLGDPPFGAGILSLSGGDVTRTPFDVPNPSECDCAPSIANVSPDGSRLLVFGRGDYAESELWNVESSGRSAHLLTKATDATWSHDGKQVVYSTAHGDLFVVRSDGGDSKLILPSPAGPGESLLTYSLSWSPDGTRIRFVQSGKYWDGKYWEISSSGTHLHRLLPGWDDSTLVCCGSWSPDGEFFLFLTGDTLSDWNLLRPGGHIWALDERNDQIRPPISKPIRLTEGPNLWSAPVASRDGMRIFAQQSTLRGELVRYDAESKQYQPFLGGISAQFIAFSHDGKYVAYVSFPDDILWRARLDGTERVQLTSPPFSPKSAIWSPDETHILFQNESPSGEYAIYSVSSQGGTPLRLVPEDPRPQVDPTWSPDGTRVAYCTDLRFSPNAVSYAEFETHILDLASHTITTLPQLKDGFFSPRWSPDGRSIVGMTFSHAGLALFDLQTKQYRTLLRLPSQDPQVIGWNTWSHDGHYVYFSGFRHAGFQNGSSEILRIPISGGKPERVVDLSGFQSSGWLGYWFGLDPQDTPILIRDRGTQDIYALTLERK